MYLLFISALFTLLISQSRFFSREILVIFLSFFPSKLSCYHLRRSCVVFVFTRIVRSRYETRYSENDKRKIKSQRRFKRSKEWLWTRSVDDTRLAGEKMNYLGGKIYSFGIVWQVRWLANWRSRDFGSVESKHPCSFCTYRYLSCDAMMCLLMSTSMRALFRGAR